MLLLTALLIIQSEPPAEYLRAAKRLEVTGGEAEVSNTDNKAWEIWFDLDGKIKTKDLKALQRVKGLGTIRIMTDDLSDAMVGDIKDNPNLHLLVVMSDKLTDKCCVPIGCMSGLTKLDINKASLTRTGLGELVKLKKLERLYLYNARIPDEEMGPLKSMTWLKLLDLPPTTSEGSLRAIRAALPKTTVECRKPGI